MTRGPRSVNTCPNVELPPWSSTLRNCVWLNALKNSARTSNDLVSAILVFFIREISQLLIPGPRREFLGRSPNVSSGIPGWSGVRAQFGSETGHALQTMFVGSIQKLPVIVFPPLHWLGKPWLLLLRGF